MDLFALFTLVGGLALFLYGMTVMGNGLEKVSGGRLERTLEKMTSNPAKGVLLGAAVTAVIQSSSATTVMVVGFVNSGIMKLRQGIGIIMGANIGTTVTAWILSLTGLQGDSVLVKMLNPNSFAPILAMVGVVLMMVSKNGKKKDVGTIFIGFAVLMFGMSAMSGAVKPLADVPEFTRILTYFSNPLLGVLTGAVLTAIIQSSSASVGILQALSSTGGITFGAAVPIIMGQNIGTCVTALISCIGANKNAKRAAMVHLYFNIIGTIVFLGLFYGANALLRFSFVSDPLNAADIAVVHTIFNLFSTALLLPFSRGLERLASWSIREKDTVCEEPALDERFLNTPAFALEQCKKAAADMAGLSRDTLLNAMGLLQSYQEKSALRILEQEEQIDRFEDRLGTYLVRLSSRELTARDSNEISKLLHTIGDLERIGDHAVNLLDAAREMQEKGIRFSQQAAGELKVLAQAVTDIVDLTIRAFVENDIELARRVEPLEQVVDSLKAELKIRHIQRLKEGTCTIELGFVLSDLLTNYERVSDHCSNIAVCLIQIAESQFDTHGYLNELKNSGQPQFVAEFKKDLEKYALPQ